MELVRNYKTQSGPCAYGVGKLKLKLMKTSKDLKVDHSNSFNTETTCLDLSTIDCQDFNLKSSDSYRKLKIDLRTGEGDGPVSLGMTLQSPLSKIPEMLHDLEKTPAFKANPNVLRNRRNAGCSSTKKTNTKQKRTSSLKKPLKLHKDSSANKENSENPKTHPNSKLQSEKTEENILKILVNQEKAFNSKISELSNGNELKIRELEEKIFGLKKENQRLVKLVNHGGPLGLKSFGGSELNRPLNGNEDIQGKASVTEQESKGSLCTKCKAFVCANNDLSTKIERLRDFLNND